ncbi:hypothetical protein ACJX0J_016178, partial [Zea mays]
LKSQSYFVRACSCDLPSCVVWLCFALVCMHAANDSFKYFTRGPMRSRRSHASWQRLIGLKALEAARLLDIVYIFASQTKEENNIIKKNQIFSKFLSILNN